MNIQKILICLLVLPIFFSCSNKKMEIVFASSNELLKDASDASFFKKKYEGNVIYLEGKVLYIGVPKDNFPKKNKTYIAIAEDNKTAVLVYFDFFVDNFVKENQNVKIKCKFKKYEKPNLFYDGIFIEFCEGEILEVLD